MRPELNEHQVSSGAKLALSREAVQRLAESLEASAAEQCGVETLTVGGFPPGDGSPAGARLILGDAISAGLYAWAEPADADSEMAPCGISLTLTSEGVRALCRSILATSGLAIAPEAASQLERIAANGALADTSPAVAARALELATALADAERAALRQRERAELELRNRIEQTERNRAHAALARALAHHFNNRLAVIMARADLLALSLGDELSTRCATQIAEACRSCVDILVRMQSYAARRAVSTLGPARLDEVVENALTGLRPFIEAVNAVQPGPIEVQTDFQCDLPIALQREDMHSVVEALVTNAVEAMPDGGRLSVRTKCEESWAVLEVADTGQGMREDVARRIFHPFYTTKGAGRTGLSLGQVHTAIVEAGGAIDVQTTPGEGSVFHVRIPTFAPRGDSQGPSSRRARSGAVLVIEDEDDVREALADVLEAMGHHVVAASGGRIAERLAGDREIGLVLTDLGVPDLTAFELAPRLRKKGLEAPIVLLTGWGHDVDPAAASEAGIDLILTKPISAAELRAALESLGMEPEWTAQE